MNFNWELPFASIGMEKYLRPERFSETPNTSGSDKLWTHWKRTFQSFMTSINLTENNQKLEMLVNFVSPPVYEFIADSTDYDNALQALEALYITPKNEVFARHVLATRKQESGESLDEFVNSLKLISKDCNFKPVSAAVYQNEMIRDSFINGLQFQYIRQRLLENAALDLQSWT